MSLTFEFRTLKPPLERHLLRYWGEDLRRMKAYRKHLNRIWDRNEYVRLRQEARVVDARIKALRDCVHQVHILQEHRRRGMLR